MLAACFTRHAGVAQVVAEEPPAMRRGTERDQQSAGDEKNGIVNQRTTLNLVGVVDTESGESRRNENIFLNPIDNNTLKELNLRLGTTATVIEFFRPERNYFAAEFGNSPSTPLHVASSSAQQLHGNVFFRHLNSAVKARSFFQAGACSLRGRTSMERHSALRSGKEPLFHWKAHSREFVGTSTETS
jgi:hypothetical protein